MISSREGPTPRAGLLREGRRAARPAARSSREAGSATVELAVSLPALALLLYAGLTAVGAVRTQLECVDAAREAARAAARGDSPPPSAIGSLAVVVDGDVVRATVRAHERPLGRWLPGFEISATAVAAREPSSGPP